jgi:hypothetical protein
MYGTAHRSNLREISSTLTRRAVDLVPYGLVAVMILAALLVLQSHHPIAYLYFIHEDSVGENSTAIAFALAAVLLIWESGRSGPFLRRCILIAVAAGALFIAGEEISWGQRIFGIGTPEGLSAINFQGELNLHNIEGVQRFPKYRPLGAALLLGLVVSIALGPLQLRSDAILMVRALPLLQLSIAPLVLLTAWELIFIPFVRPDEVGEWLVSLCLLAWATNLALDRRSIPQRLVPVASLGALVGVVLLGAGLSVAFPPDPDLPIGVTAESFAKRGMYEAAEQVSEYIRSHP